MAAGDAGSAGLAAELYPAMSRILFVSEMGKGYGHLLPFLPIAQRLTARGHEVVVCARDLSRVASLLEPRGLRFLQSPVWLPTTAGLPPSQSYADILLRYGFLDTDGLAGLVGAWQGLYDLLQPDLLIFDHAPAALTAAADRGVPRAVVGSGFVIPPLVEPLPSFRWWEPPDTTALTQASAHALQTINGWRERRGLRPWDQLSRLFAVEETFLCTFPELDHYDGRGGEAHYWGPLANLDEGDPPPWPGVDAPRIFAYLYPDDARFPGLVESLRTLQASTVIYAPGLSATQVRQLASTQVRFSGRLVRLSQVQQEAQLVISHGGGTARSAALAGLPLLILPQHIENLSLALRLQNLGAALVVTQPQPAPDWRNLCMRLLNDQRFTVRAQALAAAHGDWSSAGMVMTIADRCEELLR